MNENSGQCDLVYIEKFISNYHSLHLRRAALSKPSKPSKPSKERYTFKAPAEVCIDYFKVAQDLTPSKPLAIVEYDGVYHFIVHKDVVMKGKALNMNLIFEATDDPSEISNVVDLVRHVAKSPWPNRVRNQTVNVTIIKA